MMLTDERIAEIKQLADGRYLLARYDDATVRCGIDDLLTEREELLTVREAARKLAAELPDFALDYTREVWGNTNTAVVQHWRDELLAALAVKGEHDAD